ncbi:MAG: DUF262 domain-containing protein [Candidatus Adiutrix sp.]|jgi:hypothetical protein|nr:DUF262 domain-containing protein [Candidatus Adiutrix sp.]
MDEVMRTADQEQTVVLALKSCEAPLDGEDIPTPQKDGEPAGVSEPFDTRRIRIEPKNGMMSMLLSRLEHGELILDPDFQRHPGIWTEGNQSRLIESLMLHIPIPAFYFDGTNNDQWLVVDGLQRLTAVDRFVRKKNLRLTNLEYLRDYEGRGYDDLPRPLQRAIQEADIVWYLIMPGTPDNVKFNVFRRINTGGLPLSAQEIRHALNKKPVTAVIAELADSREFKDATAFGVSATRMDDRECVTRFLVFSACSPDTYDKDDFDAFLHTGMRYLNEHADLLDNFKDKFLSAMRLAKNIFDDDAFRKRYSRESARFPVNKALFEAWSVNLSQLTSEQQVALVNGQEELKDEFISLCGNKDFEDAITQGTGAIRRVKCRFSEIRRIIEKVLAHA